MAITNFKDLLIWQRGIELTTKVYFLTKSFPKEEMFGITSQMRRASFAVPSNIAEGWMQGGDKTRIHFLNIAKGSLAELETFTIIAGKLKFLSELSVSVIANETQEIIKMINGLKKHLLVDSK